MLSEIEDCTIITTEKKLETLIAEIKADKEVSLSECYDDGTLISRVLVGLSLSTKKHNYYTPLNHQEESKSLSEQLLFASLGKVLLSNDITIIGSELKSFVALCTKHTIEIKADIKDISLADYLVAPNGGKHQLDLLAQRHLGKDILQLETLVGKGRNKKGIETFTPLEVGAIFAQ